MNLTLLKSNYFVFLLLVYRLLVRRGNKMLTQFGRNMIYFLDKHRLHYGSDC